MTHCITCRPEHNQNPEESFVHVSTLMRNMCSCVVQSLGHLLFLHLFLLGTLGH